MELEKQPTPEGSVDWDAANPLNTPDVTEHSEDGTEFAFAPRQFKYRGKTLTAQSPEEATAIEELIVENRRQSGRLGDENHQLKERLARLEGRLDAPTSVPVVPDILPPTIDLARTDPERWQADLLAYNAAMAARLKDEIESDVRAELTRKDQQAAEEAAVRSWGDGFYAAHDHLDNPHRRTIVQAVYREHAKEIASFGDDTGAAYDRLAELADDAIAVIAGSGRPSRHTTRPPRLEGPSARSVTRQPDPERPALTGNSWLAKERARMRGETGKA